MEVVRPPISRPVWPSRRRNGSYWSYPACSRTAASLPSKCHVTGKVPLRAPKRRRFTAVHGPVAGANGAGRPFQVLDTCKCRCTIFSQCRGQLFVRPEGGDSVKASFFSLNVLVASLAGEGAASADGFGSGSHIIVIDVQVSKVKSELKILADHLS